MKCAKSPNLPRSCTVIDIFAVLCAISPAPEETTLIFKPVKEAGGLNGSNGFFAEGRLPNSSSSLKRSAFARVCGDVKSSIPVAMPLFVVPNIVESPPPVEPSIDLVRVSVSPRVSASDVTCGVGVPSTVS